MINVAMIGAGGVARRHRAGWIPQEGGKVVAVADLMSDRAAEAAAEVGAEQSTTDYLEVLARDDVDAVDICTTERTHGDIAVAVAEHGKHILVEKPIATTLEDADRMIAAAEANGVTLMVGHTHRFYDYSVAAKGAIDSGEIGSPVYLKYASGGGFWTQDWTGNRISPGDTGGNVVTNGCHIADLCNWWMGASPISIYGQALNQTSSHLEMDDYFMFTIKYDNGAIAVAECSRANMPRSNQFKSIILFGTEGELSTGTEDESYWVDGDDGLNFTGPDYQHGFTRMIGEFVDCVAEGTPSPVSGTEGRTALAMCLAAEESIRTGEVVEL